MRVQNEMDGSDGTGCRETLSRGCASPERIKSGPPRVDSSGAWVGTHLCGMRDSMVALARHGKARGSARISYGGWTWRSTAGECGSGGARATDHQKLAPKDRTDRGVAHRGRGADGFAVWRVDDDDWRRSM